MDPRDTAPDSWELEEEDAEAQAVAADLQASFAALNVNAKPFVPNVNAAVFVPSFFQASPAETPAPVAAPDPVASMEVAETAAPVENGSSEAKMTTEEETWEQKEEPGGEEEEEEEVVEKGEGGEGGEGEGEEDLVPGGACEEGAARIEEEEMMEEEEEEMPMPKVAPAPPNAPKKEHVNVVFIGHVDAGKSTIGGQIMYLTGMVEKRTLEKYEREAKEKNRETWYLSWALDTNQEERDKGKTVEVGRAYFETEKKHFTILDAPGHKSFVPQHDRGGVISARKGEFETGFEKGGQTREHAMLAKTAGVKHLIVLVNKMDDPTVNWSLDRYEECKEKLVPFLKKVGFNPKKDIYFMPCSGLTGANLKDPLTECLVHGDAIYFPPGQFAKLHQIQRRTVRLPIVDKYKDMGTVILGKLESGCISKAQQLIMMPNRHTVEVLSLLSDDVETDDATPGENLKLRLKGIEEEEILPGFILCSPDNICHSGRTFDAQALICLVDKKSGEKSKVRPRFVKQDQVCIARLRAAGTICLETFKDFPQMGRFTLRDEGKTIAIGKVLKLVPEKTKRLVSRPLFFLLLPGRNAARPTNSCSLFTLNTLKRSPTTTRRGIEELK
ncbi:hypothetical protein F7725_013992 [Dissostichus mawsoni]|uniref:Tr-type G domain-containing protein n=1 Tax=Dissostichus mawsoni TaxID=36200 RepID=A0A7J5YUN9_DISMA|nr:hypothetical protein F7725_013992 [Dissostichus mawsoni]